MVSHKHLINEINFIQYFKVFFHTIIFLIQFKFGRILKLV